MNWLVATLSAILLTVFACTPEPHSTPLPPTNPILLQKEKEKLEPPPSGTIDQRLDRLQGQLEWVQHRIPKEHSK